MRFHSSSVFFSAFYPSVQSIYSLLLFHFQRQIALTLKAFALDAPFARIPSMCLCVVRCNRSGCIDCTGHANCQLIVNHLLVDFNRISHTFVSCRAFPIQNGFEEIKYDYSADLKNVSRLRHRYCVSNIILSMFVCVRCAHDSAPLISQIHSNRNHCLGSSVLNADMH